MELKIMLLKKRMDSKRKENGCINRLTYLTMLASTVMEIHDQRTENSLLHSEKNPELRGGLQLASQLNMY